MTEFLSKETSKAHSLIETLSLNGQRLPPLVEWTQPPAQIPPKRLEPFQKYLRSLGLHQTTITSLIENIRYIDQDTTTKALQTLAEKLANLVKGKPYVLTYLPGQNKSGFWVTEQLANDYGLSTGVIPPQPVDALVKLIHNGSLPPDTQIIIADDLAIFGEQVSSHVIAALLEQCGQEWATNITVGLIAASNHLINGFTRGYLDKVRVLRVFEVPTLAEMQLPPLPAWNNEAYILTFFDHKVPDRFLPLLTRSASGHDKNGHQQWLVDDLSVPPPYDQDRFNTGMWADVAKRTTRDIPPRQPLIRRLLSKIKNRNIRQFV